jgi:hypothetical protein
VYPAIAWSLAAISASQSKTIHPLAANWPAQKLLPAPDIPSNVKIMGVLLRLEGI